MTTSQKRLTVILYYLNLFNFIYLKININDHLMTTLYWKIGSFQPNAMYMIQILLVINELELSELNLGTWITHKVFRVQKEGNQMPPGNSFEEYLPWADSTQTI